MCTAAYKGKGKSRLLCTCSLTLSLFMLMLSSIICRNLILHSFKKDLFVKNCQFFPTRSVSVTIKKGFFTYKSLRFEVSKNNFFLKQNVWSTLYFNVIPYFEKNHVQCSVVNTVYRACLSKSKHEGGEGYQSIKSYTQRRGVH